MFQLRPAKAEDINFILNSWLKRYRDAISARLVTDRVYYQIQHKVIRKILEQPGLVIKVACNPDDENQIYGYVVAENNHLVPDLQLLHWVYVKGPFRRFGLGKELLKAVALPERPIIHYTHRTHLLPFLDKAEKWVFNPAYVWMLL